MKAVIVTGGKQYTVAEGDVIYVEKLGVEAENTVTFDQVLAVVDGENSKFGTPMLGETYSIYAHVSAHEEGRYMYNAAYYPQLITLYMDLYAN